MPETGELLEFVGDSLLEIEYSDEELGLDIQTYYDKEEERGRINVQLKIEDTLVNQDTFEEWYDSMSDFGDEIAEQLSAIEQEYGEEIMSDNYFDWR